MNRQLRVFVSLIVAAFGVVSPFQESLALRPVGAAMNSDFAFKLFREAVKEKTDNVVISPTSAHLALSMTVNGATGETLKQMAQALGVDANDLAALNERNKALIDGLNATKGIQIEVANAIFADMKTPFKKEFIALCQKVYQAEARNRDFRDPKTVQEINVWVNQKTHGKIPTLLESLSPMEIMVLLNAIYFKGTWESQFEKGLTADDKFTTLDGVSNPVKMMHKNYTLSYLKGNTFESVVIPYKGLKQKLYIFLPKKGQNFADFQATFTRQNWNTWRAQYKPEMVNLSLPRLLVRYSAQLSDPLKAIGMSLAFDPDKASFLNMLPSPGAYISRVVQKTYLELNEEGTEAAAATAVMMAPTSAPISQVEFRVDRPFIIALVDESQDEVLFLGSIVKP